MENEKEVKVEILGYFEGLFKKIPSSSVESVLECIHPCVQPQHNRDLLAEVTSQEIKEIMFSLGPHKAQE